MVGPSLKTLQMAIYTQLKFSFIFVYYFHLLLKKQTVRKINIQSRGSSALFLRTHQWSVQLLQSKKSVILEETMTAGIVSFFLTICLGTGQIILMLLYVLR